MNNQTHNLKVAIIGCVHGDEPIGKMVIDRLGQIKVPTKISVTGIIANPRALKTGKRMIVHDLNRIFPGKKHGKHEDRLAYRLKKRLQKFDLCIDIHATNSDMGPLAIVTRTSARTRELLKHIPVERVAVMTSRRLGHGSLIHHSPLGVCLEYGPNKSGANYRTALRDVESILNSLAARKCRQAGLKGKTLYRVTGPYTVPEGFKPDLRLKNFTKIKKGAVIGQLGGKAIICKKTFYPLFLGKGRYESTLALMAAKMSAYPSR